MKLLNLVLLLLLSHLVMGQNAMNRVNQLDWERLGVNFNAGSSLNKANPDKDIVDQMMFSHFITNATRLKSIGQQAFSSYAVQVAKFEAFKRDKDAYGFGKVRRSYMQETYLPIFILNDPKSLRKLEGNAAQYRWQERNQRRVQFRNFSQEWEGEGIDIREIVNWNWFNR